MANGEFGQAGEPSVTGEGTQPTEILTSSGNLNQLIQEQLPGFRPVGDGVPVEIRELRRGPAGGDTLEPTGRYVIVVTNGTVSRYMELAKADTAGGIPNWRVTKPPADLPAGSSAKSAEELASELALRAAQTTSAQATAAQTEEQTRQLKIDRAQREDNYKRGKGYLTDAEITKIEQDGRRIGLDEAALDQRKAEASISARQRDRQLDIDQANSDVASANSRLNQRKLELDQIVQEDQSKAEWAKIEYAKERDNADRSIREAQLNLDRLTRQQENEVAQGNLAVRQQELQQHREEAQTVAETARQTAAVRAASDLYTTERQAQTSAAATGQNLLANRATAANALMENILGKAAGFATSSAGRYGALGGGLTGGLPAGIGENLLRGSIGVTGAMFGGQSTLDAAAAAVRAVAPGAELTPQGQLALAAIKQVLDVKQGLQQSQQPSQQQQTEQQTQQQFTAPPVYTPSAEEVRAQAAREAQARANLAAVQGAPTYLPAGPPPAGSVPGPFPAGMFTAPPVTISIGGGSGPRLI
jgi:hypothetical protein